MDTKLIATIVAMAFICELVDSSLGMGYGTTQTPVLLLLGFEPLEIVPAVLFSECVTGLLAGICHHEFGNVNFRPGSRDFGVVGLLTGTSLIGVFIAVAIAVNIPAWLVKLYIGVIVFGIGLAILITYRSAPLFSWRRVAGLGLLAAFNKGLSGGGYGPIVTGGQVLSGIRGRSAVGIASLAEGVTSAVGVLVYIGSAIVFPWHLAIPLLVGAVTSAPLAAYAVSYIPTGRLTLCIGSFTTALGGYTLIRVLI